MYCSFHWQEWASRDHPTSSSTAPLKKMLSNYHDPFVSTNPCFHNNSDVVVTIATFISDLLMKVAV